MRVPKTVRAKADESVTSSTSRKEYLPVSDLFERTSAGKMAQPQNATANAKRGRRDKIAMTLL